MHNVRDIMQYCLNLKETARVEKILRLLIDLGRQVVGADEGSLLLAAEREDGGEGTDLIFAMTLGSRESEIKLRGLRVPVGEGVTGIAAFTCEVQVGGPLYALKGDAADGKPPEGDPQTVMAAPMMCDGELIGVITAITFDPKKTFTPDHMALFGKLAAVAGVIVDQQLRLQKTEADSEESISVATERLAAVCSNDPARTADVVQLLTIFERLATPRGGKD